MGKILLRICLVCLAMNFIHEKAHAQVDFYDLNTVQEIEIFFSQPNWDYQLDTAKHGVDDYIIADWVKINGEQFDEVGVKYKGNSSFDSTYIKNPIHIELNHVTSLSYQGFTDIKLGNNYADPSVIREVLAYQILSNYMDCPRSNFARVVINGSYIGLYSNDESISKKFCSRNFNSSSGTFIKCNPNVTPGPTTKSNLRFITGGDSTSYFNFYELKSDFGWSDLIQLCDSITNNPNALNSIMNIDRVIWMLAYNTVLVNLDSYTGVFCQNYYIYKDKNNLFNPIVWDLNMSFGGFPFVGSGGTSMGSLTIANMQQLSPTFHDTDPFWPLINAVLNNPTWRKQFIAHARTINNENFVNGDYLIKAMQLQQLIDSDVQSDVNSFFTYSQFQGGITTDYSVGSYMVPGIGNLMSSRSTFLQSVPEFQLVPPQIVSVNPNIIQPQLNQSITILADVSSANSVYLGYRNSTSSPFVRIEMFDDGNHNDGSAGDNIYGVDLTVTTLLTQYFVYAENNNAGIFSPERAEHEFYTLQTQWTYPSPGDIVINEFVAVNLNGKVNEYGVRADWIELYNTTNSDISLYGLYLTDNFDRMAKFAIPQNTIIPAKGYFTLWADEADSSPQYVHTNFRLAAEGEQLMLSDGFSLVMDSITYGQQLDDVSTGRCPDGTGSFQFIGSPSFNSENCKTVNPGLPGWSSLNIFPNPVNNTMYFNLNVTPAIDEIKIYNCLGSLVKKIVVNQNYIDLITLSEGVYFVEFYSTSTGDRKVLKMVKAVND